MNTKETYKVKSANFDESVVIEFDLVVDIPEASFHEFNNFWAFSDIRLSAAKNDIKQVFCDLYAAQLIRGFIYDSVHNDNSANSYIERQEGFYPSSEVTIKNFYCDFDTSTETKYQIVEA